jgi:hypothetical protein
MTRSVWIKAANAASPRGPNRLPSDSEGRSDIRFIRITDNSAFLFLRFARVLFSAISRAQLHIGKWTPDGSFQPKMPLNRKILLIPA